MYEILGVFSSVALCAYNWSFIIFFWDLPSLLLGLSLVDVIGYAAYQVMLQLLASTIVTAFIVVFCLLMPLKSVRNNLLVSGSLLAYSLALISAYYKVWPIIVDRVASSLSMDRGVAVEVSFGFWIFLIVLLPTYSMLFSRNQKISDQVRKFVKNLGVLVSVYVVLSILGVFVVFFRNLR